MLEELKCAVLEGDEERAAELTRSVLEEGIEPVEVTPEGLLAAILQADALGRAARGRR